ncbi:hypothetical protein ACBJ59_36355 [Nonomuraea sp. MTCD27]|uniref:hypothetical protein n=1 Tax=Nonomuraea sp. MTCD27 TaxID=1676747 RepID=UPI0035C07CC1
MTAELAAWSGTADIERAADPGEFVVQACERAKQWLVEALENGDIEQIVELKSQAEAIRIYSMQKQLGKDAQLSAAEIVRRAERGIGVAIRKGQEAGEIKTVSDGGWKARDLPALDEGKKSPTSFFGSKNEATDAYAMTDDVSDEEFEAALKEAKAEENLSRANVVRKVQGRPRPTTGEAYGDWTPVAADRSFEAVMRRRELIRDLAAKGYSSRQISERIGTHESTVRQISRDHSIDIPADAVVSRTRRHDSNRIVRETVHALEGLAMGIDLIVFDDLDPDEIEDWTISLANSIRALNRLNKKMKEMVQ